MSDDRLPDHQLPEATQPVQRHPQLAPPPPAAPYTQPLAQSSASPYARPLSQPVAQAPGYAMSHTQVAGTGAGGVHITIAWIFAVLSVGYFLPWAVAATRHKSNALAIALLNFFVRWTVIGWIAALVMACASEAFAVHNVAYAYSPTVQPPPLTPPPGWYPHGPGQRYWDGRAWTEHTAPQ